MNTEKIKCKNNEFYLQIYNFEDGDVDFGLGYTYGPKEALERFRNTEAPEWPNRLELIYAPVDIEKDNMVLRYKYSKNGKLVDRQNKSIKDFIEE